MRKIDFLALFIILANRVYASSGFNLYFGGILRNNNENDNRGIVAQTSPAVLFSPEGRENRNNICESFFINRSELETNTVFGLALRGADATNLMEASAVRITIINDLMSNRRLTRYELNTVRMVGNTLYNVRIGRIYDRFIYDTRFINYVDETTINNFIPGNVALRVVIISNEEVSRRFGIFSLPNFEPSEDNYSIINEVSRIITPVTFRTNRNTFNPNTETGNFLGFGRRIVEDYMEEYEEEEKEEGDESTGGQKNMDNNFYRGFNI